MWLYAKCMINLMKQWQMYLPATCMIVGFSTVMQGSLSDLVWTGLDPIWKGSELVCTGLWMGLDLSCAKLELVYTGAEPVSMWSEPVCTGLELVCTRLKLFCTLSELVVVTKNDSSTYSRFTGWKLIKNLTASLSIPLLNVRVLQIIVGLTCGI